MSAPICIAESTDVIYVLAKLKKFHLEPSLSAVLVCYDFTQQINVVYDYITKGN